MGLAKIRQITFLYFDYLFALHLITFKYFFVNYLKVVFFSVFSFLILGKQMFHDTFRLPNVAPCHYLYLLNPLLIW